MEIKTFATYEDMLAAAKAAGIKDAKLDEAIDASNVPSDGTIEEIQLIENGAMSHIRARFNDRSTCSHSRLRGQAFFGDKKDVQFSKGTKPETANCLFLKTQILNPNLPADGARLIELRGKKITAEKRTGYILPYREKDGKPEWYTTEAEAKKALVARDFWAITIH